MIVRTPLASQIREFLATRSFLYLLGLWFGVYISFGLLFALAYWACGEGSVSMSNGPTYAKGLDFIYFSFTTWATIGYGDFVPASTASKFLSILQGFTSTTLNALLLSIIIFKSMKRSCPIIFPDKLVYEVKHHRFWFRFMNIDPEQLRDVQVKIYLLRYLINEAEGMYDTLTSEVEANIKYYPSRPSLNLTALRTTSNEPDDGRANHPGDFNLVKVSPLHFNNYGPEDSGSWVEIHFEINGYFESTGERFFARKEYQFADIKCGKYDDVSNNKLLEIPRKDKIKYLDTKFNSIIETPLDDCLHCPYLRKGCELEVAQKNRRAKGHA